MARTSRYSQEVRERAVIQAVMAEYSRVFGPMTEEQEKTAEMVTQIADQQAERIAPGGAVYQPETIVTGYRM